MADTGNEIELGEVLLILLAVGIGVYFLVKGFSSGISSVVSGVSSVAGAVGDAISCALTTKVIVPCGQLSSNFSDAAKIDGIAKQYGVSNAQAANAYALWQQNPNTPISSLLLIANPDTAPASAAGSQ